MITSTFSATHSSPSFKRRTIMCVDPDPSYTAALRDSWLQLRLADDLHVVRSHAEALEFLGFAQGKNGGARMAAIVLDPDVTGEATGSFLRDVRKQGGPNTVPIVLWSWDIDKYRLLEGRGVAAVVRKPRILRLIQELDAACQLSVQRFRPYMGNSSFVHFETQPDIRVGL